MMPTQYGMVPQQSLDDELAKERQSGYGWITNSVTNNCKSYTFTIIKLIQQPAKYLLNASINQFYNYCYSWMVAIQA